MSTIKTRLQCQGATIQTSLSSSIFNNANAACNKASEMLTEDCSMLLRKATNVYSKATTK